MRKPPFLVPTATAGLAVGHALRCPMSRSLRAIRFDGGSLGAKDVAKRAALEPPAVRPMLAAPAQRKAFVENVVKFEPLATEAVRKGYDRDPQFLEDSRQRLGQLLLDRDVTAPLAAKAPTDADLKRFFDQNAASLSRPARIRIAAISFVAPEGNDYAFDEMGHTRLAAPRRYLDAAWKRSGARTVAKALQASSLD